MFQNNGLLTMISALKNASNPMDVLTTMAKSNAELSKILPIVNGKNENQLEQIARNMAKERGIDIDSLAKTLGLK